jgi:hypothetical protein
MRAVGGDSWRKSLPLNCLPRVQSFEKPKIPSAQNQFYRHNILLDAESNIYCAENLSK